MHLLNTSSGMSVARKAPPVYRPSIPGWAWTSALLLLAALTPCRPAHAEGIWLEDFEGNLDDDWIATGMWHKESQTDFCGLQVTPFPGQTHSAYFAHPDSCSYMGSPSGTALEKKTGVTLPAAAAGVTATLRFWSYEGTECNNSDCDWDKRRVEIAGNSGAWTALGTCGQEGEWYLKTFDVTPYLGQTVRLRFRFDMDSWDNQFFGWMIDQAAIVVTRPSNATPTAVDDHFTTNNDTPLHLSAGALVGNDVDPDMDALVALVQTNAAHGTVVTNADGSFDYTPNAEWTGVDSFTYRARDQRGALSANTAVALITVNTTHEIWRDGFENGLDDWQTADLWHIENQSDTCGAQVAPFPGATRSAYFGSAGMCNYTAGSYGTFTLEKETGVVLPAAAPGKRATLRFSSYERTECNGFCYYDKRWVDISVNGGDWTALGLLGREGKWYIKTFDLTHYLGQTVRVRFRFEKNSSNNGFFGWMIDDVAIAVASNQAPTPVDDHYTTNQETSLHLPATALVSNDSDPNADGLVAIAQTSVGHGHLVVNYDGSFDYTPNVGWWGTDSFTYRARDAWGMLSAAVATVTLTVRSVPSDTNEFWHEGFEDDANDWQANGFWHIEQLTNTCGRRVTNFLDPTHSAYFGKTDACTYLGLQAGVTLEKETGLLLPPNEPGASAMLSFSSFEQTECGGYCSLNFDERWVDISVDGGNWVALGECGSENRWYLKTFDLTPYLGHSIRIRFRFDSVDADANNFLGWMVDNISVTVTNLDNLAPIAVLNDYSTNENSALHVPAQGVLENDFDLDSDPLFNSIAAAVETSVTHGRLDLQDDGSFVYTPDADWSGEDTFTYRVRDAWGKASDASAAVRIAVSATKNDPPVNTIPPEQTILPNSILVFSKANGNYFSVFDPDIGSAPLRITVDVDRGTLTLRSTTASHLTFTDTLDAVNSSLDGMVFTPPSSFNGTVILTITSDDQGASGPMGAAALSDTDSATINVVEPAPVWVDANYDETTQDGGLTISPRFKMASMWCSS